MSSFGHYRTPEGLAEALEAAKEEGERVAKEIVKDFAIDLNKAFDTPDYPKKQSTEGIKHDGDKLRYDLIPPMPLEELARVYTIGAKKYSDRNWEKGMKWGRIFAAMMRHAWKWLGGETHDPVDGQHHLASVAWCAFALIEFEKTHPELDDRSK